MLLRRPPLLSALLLLLLAACRCTAAALLRGSAARTEALAERLELNARYRSRADTAAGLPGARGGGLRSHQGSETNHRDPQQKEKFIIHLTGPLTFDPKCRKQFYRLYHGTRDCTVPAYYRRCARLLTQLAKSPRCAER